MKVLSVFGGALVAFVVATAALADPPPATPPGPQPPMNSFDSAFYDCDGGGAFQMSYDSDTPQTATMTTNDNNHAYTLTRAAADASGGVAFANGPTKFWTDGHTVRVVGASQPLTGCRLKPS